MSATAIAKHRRAATEGFSALHRVMIGLSLFVIVAAGMSSTQAVATAADLVPASAPAGAQADFEQGVLTAVNTTRSEHGLGTLHLASCPERMSARWAEHLVPTGGLYHQSMTGLLRRCGARYVGENLARGFSDPQDLVQAWMESPKHRAVLLSPTPRSVGISVRMGTDGQWVTAADFVRR